MSAGERLAGAWVARARGISGVWSVPSLTACWMAPEGVATCRHVLLHYSFLHHHYWMLSRGGPGNAASFGGRLDFGLWEALWHK
jgi:hypothetical protein